jgi:outer membrane receptor for ferrienterochelin and colicin
MDLGYTQLTSASLRNSTIVPYRINNLYASPNVKGALLKWIAVEYSLLASKNKMVLTDDNAKNSYTNLKQKLNVSLFLTKKIQAFAGAEHYHTKFDDNTADDLVLLDMGARWTVSDRVDVNLSATNLLNDANYCYTRYETLSETVYRYRIRPRNVILSVQVKI